MSQALFSLRECSALRQGKQVLSDLSLSLRSGRIMSVLGPNGAGKSSLLSLLSGEIAPSHGELRWEQEALAFSDAQKRAKHVAVLPQHSALSFDFSVRDVLMLGRTPHETGRKVDEQIVADLIQQLDLQDLQQRPYTALSGGEKQRVQIGRVLAQVWRVDARYEQEILLLDEPVAALDLAHQQSLMRLLQGLRDQGMGIIMVLHDLNLALRYADEFLLLKGGRCLAQAEIEALADLELLASAYDCQFQKIEHDGNCLLLPI